VDQQAVALKTDKGLDEVRTRAAGLPQKLRTLLIMVDGKTTVGELLAKFPGVAEVGANLQVLVDQGLVALRPSGAAGAPSSSPAGAVPAAAPPAETRQQSLRGLTRFLTESLGPDADLVTGGLEQARSRGEFEAAVVRAADMLDGLAAARKAAAFREQARRFADRFLAG
jgi:hypothetical protein